MIVREATRSDIEKFYPDEQKPTMKAWVAENEGKIIGACGLALSQGRWTAFCDLADEMRPFKKAILQTGRLMMEEAKRSGMRYVYSVPNPDEPNAKRLLSSLGFEPDPRSEHVYRWRSGE